MRNKPTCRARQCPECRRYAGHHRTTCRYLQRWRRPPRPSGFDVVRADHVCALFTACHAKAVRLAQYVGALTRSDAEDVVGDVFLWIWQHRDAFPTCPGRAYLDRAVTHGTLRPHGHAWARYVVAMDPRDLVLAEQANYDPTQPAIAVPV